MQLDVPTLMAAASFVAAISGVLVYFAWTHSRTAPGLLVWAAADVAYAVGLAGILAGQTGGRPLVILAGATAINLGGALFLVATRLLNHAKPPVAILVAGTTAPFLPLLLGEGPSLGMAIGLGVFAMYSAAAALSFWRARGEALKARWPLMALFILMTVVFAAGAFESAAGVIAADIPVPLASWFGLIHFVGIIFLLGTAVFVVAFERERSEAGHRTAAETDMLTGCASRGAFVAYCGRVLEECQAADTPMALIVFDLDHFKAINDNFGHAAGDRMLCGFAETVKLAMRTDDRVGRLGGEEFAVVLPGTSLGAASLVADRIRAAFAEKSHSFGSGAFAATVSAGVAIAHPHSTVVTLLSAADDGLYRAKALGRNRVEKAEPRPSKPPHLTRVA